MTIRKYIAQSALVLAIPFSVNAGDAGTVYTQLSSNGFGIGYAKSIAPDWALRGQYNKFDLDLPITPVVNESSIDVGSMSLNFSSIMALADWYPSERGFRLTGGLVFNNNKVSGRLNDVNNKKANASFEVKMSDSISPYVGVGYSVRPQNAKGFGLNFDLGIMLQNPKVTLNITDTEGTSTDVATEQSQLQDAYNELKYIPVLGFGINYSF